MKTRLVYKSKRQLFVRFVYKCFFLNILYPCETFLLLYEYIISEFKVSTFTKSKKVKYIDD